MTIEQQRIAPEPIRRILRVNAPPEKAFFVFVAGMGRWWLKSHSLLESPQRDVIVEPRAGGRWYEVGEDGSERQWGKVIDWQPPERLLLAWQLNADWTYDPGLETIIEIRFTALRDRSIVEFEHRGLEAFGERAQATRDAMDGGWGELLEGYCREAEAA